MPSSCLTSYAAATTSVHSEQLRQAIQTEDGHKLGTCSNWCLSLWMGTMQEQGPVVCPEANFRPSLVLYRKPDVLK